MTNRFKLFIIKLAILSLLAVQPFWTQSVPADMGRILATDATVSEESQKAIILHNFDEEVLILGTDLKAGKMFYVSAQEQFIQDRFSSLPRAVRIICKSFLG